MAPPVYQSPAAMSEVLGAAQSPEGIELLTQKMAPLDFRMLYRWDF